MKYTTDTYNVQRSSKESISITNALIRTIRHPLTFSSSQSASRFEHSNVITRLSNFANKFTSLDYFGGSPASFESNYEHKWIRQLGNYYKYQLCIIVFHLRIK